MTRAGIAALITSLLLALTACQDDPEPNATPHPTSPSPTTANSSPSPTFDPKKETAEEFIRRWVRIEYESQVSGRSAPYRRLVLRSCQPCSAFADLIDKISRNGGYVKTRQKRVLKIHHDGKNQWSVFVKSFPTKYTESTGSAPKTLAGGRYERTVFLKRTNAGWKLEHYLRVEP